MGDEPGVLLSAYSILIVKSEVAPRELEFGWTYVALPADHLFAVVFAGKGLERWFDDTTTETEDQVKRRFLDHQNVSTSVLQAQDPKSRIL